MTKQRNEKIFKHITEQICFNFFLVFSFFFLFFLVFFTLFSDTNQYIIHTFLCVPSDPFRHQNQLVKEKQTEEY